MSVLVGEAVCRLPSRESGVEGFEEAAVEVAGAEQTLQDATLLTHSLVAMLAEEVTMRTAATKANRVSDQADRPEDDQLDLHGLTHQGKVRKDNQDQFMICTVHPQLVIHGTSLPNPDSLPLRGTRFGTVMLVADGVGGAVDGSEASRLATESVVRYVSSTLRCYNVAGEGDDEEFFRALKDAALQAHDAVRAESVSRGEGRMATTLTVATFVWPWCYVTQVGDSRMYVLTDGKLHQATRDQTIAQQLVDAGALKKEDMGRSPLRHVLASAIGADEAVPEVTRFRVTKSSTALLCSDGLTKHVSDVEIGEHLKQNKTAEQTCQDLLELALERGGTDNITIAVARRR